MLAPWCVQGPAASHIGHPTSAADVGKMLSDGTFSILDQSQPRHGDAASGASLEQQASRVPRGEYWQYAVQYSVLQEFFLRAAANPSLLANQFCGRAFGGFVQQWGEGRICVPPGYSSAAPFLSSAVPGCSVPELRSSRTPLLKSRAQLLRSGAPQFPESAAQFLSSSIPGVSSSVLELLQSSSVPGLSGSVPELRRLSCSVPELPSFRGPLLNSGAPQFPGSAAQFRSSSVPGLSCSVPDLPSARVRLLSSRAPQFPGAAAQFLSSAVPGLSCSVPELRSARAHLLHSAAPQFPG